MKISLGMKSDPVEYRYSYEWLFDLLSRCGIPNVQLGSSFEFYMLDDAYFLELRELAERKGIRITSCFTSHRELGGWMTGNVHLEQVARRNYERYIEIGVLLGVDYVGSNPGSVYRDQMSSKAQGIERYMAHMRELMQYAKTQGLKGLTIEPMSCLAEPPTSPKEIKDILTALNEYHRQESSTVPVYLCGDISHGYADQHGQVQHDNYQLFEHEIPYMAEFHLKNTDSIFNSTFGFTPEERRKGIVDLYRVKALIEAHADQWPVDEVVGHLEIGGPKLGRDYSDYQLESLLVGSFEALIEVFG
jgi:ribulose-phosphate 3-epimerase